MLLFYHIFCEGCFLLFLEKKIIFTFFKKRLFFQRGRVMFINFCQEKKNIFYKKNKKNIHSSSGGMLKNFLTMDFYLSYLKIFFCEKKNITLLGGVAVFSFLTCGQIILGQDSKNFLKGKINLKDQQYSFYNNPVIRKPSHFKTLEKNFLLPKDQSFLTRQKYKKKAQKFQKTYLSTFFNSPKNNIDNNLSHRNFDFSFQKFQESPDNREKSKNEKNKVYIVGILQKNQELQWNMLKKAEKKERQNKKNIAQENKENIVQEDSLKAISNKSSQIIGKKSSHNNKKLFLSLEQNSSQRNAQENETYALFKKQNQKSPLYKTYLRTPQVSKEKKNVYSHDREKEKYSSFFAEKKFPKNGRRFFQNVTKSSYNRTSRETLRVKRASSSSSFGGFPCLPVLGKISSTFGYRRDPFCNKTKMHYGVDFSAPRGTPVRAILGGTIKSIGYHAQGFGRRIEIDHGYYVETLYAHLDRYAPDLYVGKRISGGCIIGYVGSSGRTSGPHLHLEYRKNNIRRNPLELFQQTIKDVKKNKKNNENFVRKKKNKKRHFFF